MRAYRLTGPARADLRAIWGHVANDSEGRADRLLDEFLAMFQKIADQPLRLGSADELYGTQYRVSQVGNYVIFYTPTADGVTIVRVIHGAQDVGGMAPF